MALPSIIDAMEFRRDAYGLTQRQWSQVLGIQQSHYSEFVSGKRALPVKAMAQAFAFGVPAECLFQCLPNKDLRQINHLLKERNA